MADDVDKPERYLIKDTKTDTYKNYEGYSTASRARNAADKLDNAHGGYRYAVVPYSKATAGSFENPDTSKAKSVISSVKGGSGRAANIDAEGGTKPGQSPSLDNPIMRAKGGYVSEADGCATKGKTKGRFV